MPTYTLGKDYTVSGLDGVSDLTLTIEADRVDVTTRKVAKPFKLTAAGLQAKTFECTVMKKVTDGSQDPDFTIGKKYTVTLAGGDALDLICMTANREEPQAGIITYKLTLRPGEESEICDQVDVGPGTYRSCE